MFGLMPVAFPLLLLLFYPSSIPQKKKKNDLRVVPVATAPSLDGREEQSQEVWWENAQIDYSAGNEYIAAHYGGSSSDGGEDSSYFAENVKMERIYDARKTTNTTFATHGFALLRCGDSQEFHNNMQLESVDWRNLSSIQTLYLSYVEHAIRNVVFRDTPVAHVMFWCPTLRTGAATDSSDIRTGSTSITPQGGYASTAHIDTDVNAYASVRDLVRMIVKNQLPEQQDACSDANNNDHGLMEDRMVTAIETHRRRFAIVNAWKNIGPTPVTDAPLAFMPARYHDNKTQTTAFPYGTLDESSCRWYTFPSMTSDELLLFAQYDRDASQASDVWHCALSLLPTSSSPSSSSFSRQSFDIRCFVLFADPVVVPPQRDRLHHRRPSRLDRSGSAAFCADQSRRRRNRRLEEENE
jgi:hypothetical protein